MKYFLLLLLFPASAFALSEQVAPFSGGTVANLITASSSLTVTGQITNTTVGGLAPFVANGASVGPVGYVSVSSSINTTSITFSNLVSSATYDIEWNIACSTASTCQFAINFNGDPVTSSSYNWHTQIIYDNGQTTTPGSGANVAFCNIENGVTSADYVSTGKSNNGHFHFASYPSDSSKISGRMDAFYNNASNNVSYFGGCWYKGGPVTSITLYEKAGSNLFGQAVLWRKL